MLLHFSPIRLMRRSVAPRIFLIGIFSSLLSLTGCIFAPSMGQTSRCPEPSSSSEKALTSLSLSKFTPHAQLLEQSWIAYRQRFIQPDGRVIDWEAGDRTTSEGQAYAMLRAVLIDDPGTFACTLNWAEHNLARKDANGKLIDRLWAWKWGRTSLISWGIQDSNFASDADIDAITALILASRRWNHPEYLAIARSKLNDLWNLSTAVVPDRSRYLLPG
ncbi:MAG: glycosyl hydrolase family 8, partial [Kovacikia sp.]